MGDALNLGGDGSLHTLDNFYRCMNVSYEKIPEGFVITRVYKDRKANR